METMKLIYRNSHFELVPAEKLPEYGNRIVQISQATKITNGEPVFLCEVQEGPETIVSLSCNLTMDEIIKAQKQVMDPTVFNLEDLLNED